MPTKTSLHHATASRGEGYLAPDSFARPPFGPGGGRLIALALTGIAGSVVCAGLIHLGPGRSLNPVSRTFSDYVLVNEATWLFNTSVLSLAVGSAALLPGLAGRGAGRGMSRAAVPLVVWCGALLLVVLFQTDPPSAPPSASGTVHRYAGAAAFVSLPLAGLLLSHRLRLSPSVGTGALRVRLLSRASAAGVALFFVTHLAATYPVMPEAEVLGRALGLAERLLLITDIALLCLLADLVGRMPRRVATCEVAAP
ncbi:DUF998 domain-containing protein [Streptomyces inhibens]|uniref:DUF998 domain-containing protein n=1 Tax=Streptomyces inhibens TaxID=2293571 RepID=UPI00378DA050